MPSSTIYRPHKTKLPHFKHWVKSRSFQFADLPGLGLFKVLVIPNEGNNKLCDIVQAVHADELKHSGYKKVLDYWTSLTGESKRKVLKLLPSKMKDNPLPSALRTTVVKNLKIYAAYCLMNHPPHPCRMLQINSTKRPNNGFNSS
ncbi:hypothetical protein EMCRGX_G009771 [Ephydatia muelleri]